MRAVCSYMWIAATCAVVTACAARSYAGDGVWTVAYKGEVKGRREHTVTHAASELAEYMGRVLGTEIGTSPWESIRPPRQARDRQAQGRQADGGNLFLITDADHAPEDIARGLDGKRRDAFLIRYPYRIDDRKVCLLVSHDARGYDYPVYYFLKHSMGCDWLGPGATGEVVPTDPDWEMPARISVLENPDFEMRYWSDVTFGQARKLLAGSHRFDFHHAFGRVYPPEKYAASDPDVYPLIDGKRKVPGTGEGAETLTAGWQPCVGNPRAQDIAVAYVLEQYEKAPHLGAISLSVNDGSGQDCQCDLCRAMDIESAFKDPFNPKLSDRYFRFYNAVIERVLVKKPDARVAVLGYGPCAQPPEQTRIHDRIVVYITTGADPRQFEQAGGSSAIYQYHLDSAYPTIRHYPRMIAQFLRGSQAVGGLGYYAEIHHNWAAAGPKVYVLAHLLWDVNSDVDALLDRYMRLAFGEQAAAPMRAYFDRWETIWEREQAELENPFDSIYNWSANQLRKFEYVRWDDIHSMDAAVAIAKAAAMTARQRERLDLFATYYRFLRPSLVQYLTTRDFLRVAWVAATPPGEVLDLMSRTLALSSEVDALWKEHIAADKSGWLLNANPRVLKAVSQGLRFHGCLYVEPIRAEVEAHLAQGVNHALAVISDATAKKTGKDSVVAYWKEALEQHEALRPFIKPELDRIQGVIHENLIANGGFERGEAGGDAPGEPPRLPGWWFYDRVGMVLGSKGRYRWESTEGAAGTRALGFGPSQYPGIRGFLEVDPGWYRFSFRYRTINRELPVPVNILAMSERVRIGDLTTPEAVRALQNDDYHKLILRSWPTTDGAWQKVSQILQVRTEQTLAVMIEPFFMNEGGWTWFDDVEMVRLY